MRRPFAALALAALLTACSTGDDTAATTTSSASASSPATTVTSGEPSTAPATESTPGPTTTLPATTTTLGLVTTGAVVMVANASGVNGAATLITAEFARRGFSTVDPTNSAGPDDRLEITKIYFLPGGYEAALSIAAAMGVTEVLPMPTPAWISGGSEALGPTTVLVTLGDDRAIDPFPFLPD